MKKNHIYYQRISSAATNERAAIWARRSLFYFSGSPLLVSEIFLPTLFSNVSIDND
ncbi:chorismate lyase [Candidatus Coxiella mudrowiae]|uniref:chorismate lyase n=1 Tax=Candidatus Coxiella mudrowiae TaxID=2054173 RepID=UPI0009E5AA89